MRLLAFLALLLPAAALVPRLARRARGSRLVLRAAASDAAPQCFATAISLDADLFRAMDAAVAACLEQLVGSAAVDLALFHVTSSHLNAVSAPEITARLRAALPGLKVYLGATCGGAMASRGADQAPVEVEAQLAFGLTLASLPGVEVKPFWLGEASLPQGAAAVSAGAWQDLFGVETQPGDEEQPVFLTYPLPGFSNALGDMLTGLDAAYPRGAKAGGIASAVSTLHKPRAWVGYGDGAGQGGAAVVPAKVERTPEDDERAFEAAKAALLADMQGRETEESLFPQGGVMESRGGEGEARDAFAAVGGLSALAEDYDDEPLDLESMLDYTEELDGEDPPMLDIGAETPQPPVTMPTAGFRPATKVPREGEDSYWDGCCGVVLKGDIRAEALVAAGARPVSPVYYCAKAEGNQLQLIRMARGKDGIGGLDPLAPAVPPLKESTRLQNDPSALAPDDARLLQRNLLVGLESMPRSAPTAGAAARILRERKEQARADREKRDKAAGKLRRRKTEPEPPLPEADAAETGPIYSVQRVLRTSMTDGSFLLPEATSEGQRMRFFVRDRYAAERSLETVLSGYKRRVLQANLVPTGAPGVVPFNPGLALMITGMDRGRAMFDEVGYESRQLATYVKAPMCGFFSNGPIAAAGDGGDGTATIVHGSSSVFLLLGPRSGRPVGTYFTQQAEENVEASETETKDWADWEGPEARRRMTDTGRSMNVGSVEWSVAEKTAQPRNRLEALVWAKEAEIDRLRDRYPLPMLLAQVKGAMADPAMVPRGFVEMLRTRTEAAEGIVVVAEVKKAQPFKGVLRADCTSSLLATDFETAGAAALSVCIDGRFYGGSPEDLAEVRKATKLPLLATEFVLYPYQIYQARISGADALRLIAAALPTTDLIYFHKIIAAQGMDPIVVCSSLVEAEGVLEALHGNKQKVRGMILSGRDYADFSASPGRVAGMLTSPRGEALKAALKEDGALLLSEGGIRTREQVDMLREAGVDAVVVGEALVKAQDAQELFKELVG